MDSLPPEIVLHVAKYVESKDCYNLALTNSQYLYLLYESRLWMLYCSLELSVDRFKFINWYGSSNSTPFQTFMHYYFLPGKCTSLVNGQKCDNNTPDEIRYCLDCLDKKSLLIRACKFYDQRLTPKLHAYISDKIIRTHANKQLTCAELPSYLFNLPVELKYPL